MFTQYSSTLPQTDVISPTPFDVVGRFWLPGGVSVPIPVSNITAVTVECDSDVRCNLTRGYGLEGLDTRIAVGQSNPTRITYTSEAHPIPLGLGTGDVSGTFWTSQLAGSTIQPIMSVGLIGGTAEFYNFALYETGGIVHATVNMTDSAGTSIFSQTNSAHRIALAAGMGWNPDLDSVTNWTYALKRNGASSLLSVWRNGVAVGKLTINDTNSALACNPSAGLAIGARSASNGQIYGNFYMGKIYKGVELNDYEAAEIAKWGPMINPLNVRLPTLTAHGALRASWQTPTMPEYYAWDMKTKLGAFDHGNSTPHTTFAQWPGGYPATVQSYLIKARSEKTIMVQGNSWLNLWTPPEVGAWVNIHKV